MTIPTHQRFVEAFGEVDGSHAYALAKRIMDCHLHPAVTRWAEQCYHDPRESADAYAECLMVALDAVLEGCGVEAIRGREVDAYHGDVQAVYVNMGDTYATTILFDHETGRLRITSWGDWVERYGERREVA